MANTQLSTASSYNPGSELWCIPECKESQWTLKIDWHLNFMNSRLEKHTWETRDEELEFINSETALNISANSSLHDKTKSAKLYLAEKYFPCKWLVFLPYDGDLSDWSAKAEKIWTGFNRPTLRVFLPPQVQTNVFLESNKALNLEADLTIVQDLT